MQTAELAVLDWIQLHLRCGFLDTVLPWISRLCDHGEIWIVLAAVLLILRSQRRYGAAVSCALVLDLVSCNLILKPLIGRLRPFAINPAVDLLVPPPLDASFPSGHTARLLCRCLCPQGLRQPSLEAGSGPGRGNGVLPALPLCPLAQRCAGRRCIGRCCGLGRCPGWFSGRNRLWPAAAPEDLW